LHRLSSLVVPVLGVGLAVSSCSIFPSGGGGPASNAAPVPPTGCATPPSNPIVPGGYYVNGNTVCTAAGQAHQFHGVDRPSLEFSVVGQDLSAADFQLMATWKANAVRIALNQDFWLPASPEYNANYASTVDTAVHWAEDAGMDVILDLHWSDAGNIGSCTSSTCKQQLMADMNSITFWSQVAAIYKNDRRVLFELYNEPHDVSWSVWQSGGPTGAGWNAAGMQQLYDTVRATGANNPVVIGGLSYAFDLSGVPAHRIAGYNILYATHPYNNGGKAPSTWDSSWGFLTATDPVIVTEFGDSKSVSGDGGTAVCASMYSQELITYADAHHANWTAWAWFVGGCSFPSLIVDWNGTPNAPGALVKAALLGYHEPSPFAADAGSSLRDAGNANDAGKDGAATQVGDGSSQ
jgi:endoglucanase